MSWVDRNLKQAVTYWPPSTADAYGRSTYGPPVKIRGRWEDKVELFIDAQGREDRSEAVVYVSRDVVNGGYLYLGVSTNADPTVVAGAKEIRQTGKSPTLKANSFARKAML